MRIHTFEKKFSLDEFSSVINNVVKPNFEINDNSYADEFNLLIIGINVKDQSIIIRGSIDKSKNRSYLSILAVHSNAILKELNTSKNTKALTKKLGKILFNIVKISNENEKNFAFSNLAIKKPIERKFQTQLVETEKKILIKLLYSLDEKENNSNILIKYPFSLFDMDGSWEIWQNIYSPYIDLVESKLIISKNNSLRTFRNYDFAFNNAFNQRIADLVISEVEEQISNLVSKRSRNNFRKLDNKIEDQYSDEVEKENYNLKITFVFTNKKIQPLKLIQMLKLSDEVKKYTQLLHKKELKQYSKIIPQIIFISLFGFEITIGDYLKDNLHGKLNRNILIMVVPPIDNKLWNNYLVENSIEDNINYEKHKWGLTFDDYKTLRKSGTANQYQVKKMETYYRDLRKSKEISEYNYQQLNIWSDVLSIKNSSILLDVETSKKIIKELKIN